MKRILVCDDEPHIVEGLRHLLRGTDRKVSCVTNGKEALQHIQQEIPDLLVIDVMMPEMTGPEAVAILRDNEQTKDLPIIILTAKGQAQDAAAATEIWGAMVLGKPFEPTKLRQLVSEILENAPCPTGSST